MADEMSQQNSLDVKTTDCSNEIEDYECPRSLAETSTRTTITKNGLTFRQDDNIPGVYTLVEHNTSILEKESISGIYDIQALIIRNKQITEIQPGAFQDMPNLVSLIIEDTKLSEIKKGVFNSLFNLNELNLQANEINSIDPEAFSNLTNLTYINLHYNKLKFFDTRWFDLTPSLYSIQLSHNLITELPANAFANVKPEGSIFLHGNKFERIDEDTFHGFKDIATLTLDNCGFETFDGHFLHGFTLERLYIRENKIACVDCDKFPQVFVANTTYIKDNPWDPECLKKILAWASENGKEINLTS